MSKAQSRAQVPVTFGFVALLLAGCVGYEPRPIEPAQAAAQLEDRSLGDPSLLAFVEANLGRSETERPSAWTLDTLTLAAFYFQPELDVARAQWAVAEAARVTAGQRPGIAPGITLANNATTSTPSPRLYTSMVDFTLETAGKRGYRIVQAEQLGEAARLNVASVAWQVRSGVRASLLSLCGALESETLLRQQQAIHAENIRILEGQFRAGAISAFELTQGRLAANSARLALRDAERAVAEARAQLASAIGMPVAALGEAAFSCEEFDRLPADLASADVRRQALLSRPDILAALSEYAASQAMLRLEIARQYPDVRLGPGYEYDQGDDKWSLGFSVTLPANRNRGPIAEATARRAEAAARFDALQTSVLGQIDLAVSGYRMASQKQADAGVMLTDLTRQAAVAQSMLELGEISRGDLAALQLQLSILKLAQLDARVQAQRAAGQVEDALQAPLGLPSTVWEASPEVAGPAQGEASP